jgi:hypothetical protein
MSSKASDENVGLIGISLFSALAFATIYTSIVAKNKYSRRIFICSALCATFELPQYITLAILQRYTDQIGYVMHMVFLFVN